MGLARQLVGRQGERPDIMQIDLDIQTQTWKVACARCSKRCAVPCRRVLLALRASRLITTPSVFDCDVEPSWPALQDMGKVSGKYIAAGLIPALIITVLFFFDHNVSSQMAQLQEFNLTKPPAYHYDFALLACMVSDSLLSDSCKTKHTGWRFVSADGNQPSMIGSV